MKQNIIIIHGSYGRPDENWFPWLKAELEKLNCNVLVPKFPTPEGQSLDAWMKILNEYNYYFDSNMIMIGHSLGVALILRKLELLNKPIKASFLVAGATGKIGNETFDKINASFFEGGFNWSIVRKNSKHFFVYHSDNDPYLPLKLGEELAKNLNVKLILVKGAGHFNEKAGYTKFPLIFDDIKKLIK